MKETLIGLTCTVFGFIISYVTLMRSRDKQIREETLSDTKAKVELSVNIKNLVQELKDIKKEIYDLSSKFDIFKDSVNARLAKCEEAIRYLRERCDKE